MKFANMVALAGMLTTCLFGEHAMVGTWKQNRARAERSDESKVIHFTSGESGITMRVAIGTLFRDAAEGKETPLTINPKDKVRIQRFGRNSFSWTLLSNGKALQTARYEVSPDGKLMTGTTKQYTGEGEGGNTTISKYKRVGGTGEPDLFDGSWEIDASQSKFEKEDVFTVTQHGDVLTIAEPNAGVETTLHLKTGEGKISGPGAPPDIHVSARVPDDQTIELTMVRARLTVLSVMTVSGDHKTLTQRDLVKTADGKETKSALVYERQ